MNKQKQTYLSPETETLVIRFEGMICSSPAVQAVMLSNIMMVEDEGYNDLGNYE